MSDLMLHGKLNMPLPNDPRYCDVVTWVQFKAAAKEASARIEELEAHLEKLTKAARPFSQMIIRNDTPRADGIRIADIIEIRAALESVQGDKK